MDFPTGLKKTASVVKAREAIAEDTPTSYGNFPSGLKKLSGTSDKPAPAREDDDQAYGNMPTGAAKKREAGTAPTAAAFKAPMRVGACALSVCRMGDLSCALAVSPRRKEATPAGCCDCRLTR
jgi:hypothetical protein